MSIYIEKDRVAFELHYQSSPELSECLKACEYKEHFFRSAREILPICGAQQQKHVVWQNEGSWEIFRETLKRKLFHLNRCHPSPLAFVLQHDSMANKKKTEPLFLED